jgi:plasmid stabilization system protein ParE
MPSYLIIIQPEAELDLDEAYEYLEQQRIGLGFELLASISDAIALLEENPFLFQKIQGEKRRIFIQRFQYNLIYKVIDSHVYILAFLHGRSNPKRWEGR